MRGDRKKRYSAGDQLHIIVLEDFVKTANEFATYCEANSINASGAIRHAIDEWLQNKVTKEKLLTQLEDGTLPTQTHVVEDAFLIYQDGALLAHATRRVVPDLDMDLFTSMLTVIQRFVKDSFKDRRDFSLKKLEFGDSKIIIEHGMVGVISLALVYKGKGKEDRLYETVTMILEDIEEEFGDVLRDWDGNLNSMRGCREIILDHLLKL